MGLFSSVGNIFKKAADPFGLVFKNKGSDQSTPYNWYTDLLNAYKTGLPIQLEMQKEFSPQFTAADLQQFQDSLTGVNGQPGYLDIYKNNLLPATLAANTATRTANVNDLSTLGPGTLTAIQGANPEETALMQQLTQSAGDQLKLGTQIDPGQMDQINNMVLNNWSNRGLGTSNPAQLDAAIQLYGGGQNLLQQREANADTVAGMQQQFYTDPLMQMVGVNSGTTPEQLAAGGSQMAGENPSWLNTDQATSILGGAYSAKSNMDITKKNNKAALWGAGISAVGNILGGAAGAI